MKNKPVKHFFALVRCLILAIPLITLGYHCFTNLTHGWETIESQSGELIEHYDGFDTKSFNNACCYAWWDYYGPIISYDFGYSTCNDFSSNLQNYLGFEEGFNIAEVYNAYGITDNGYLTFTYLNFFAFLDTPLVGYDNWGPYFFFNWYLNYLLSMSVLLFAVEIIFWFLDFVRNLMYKIGRKVD